jgi:putative intracellular protease/amidase
VCTWQIEDELKALGASFIHAGVWKGFAVRDGSLITGQQNFGGSETPALVTEALGR